MNTRYNFDNWIQKARLKIICKNCSVKALYYDCPNCFGAETEPVPISEILND